ncbi:calcium-binding protein [Nocardioides currus]|nr:calcium-binding protein [Nocardioides currus]
MHHHVRRSLAASGTTALLAAALLTAPGAHAAAATTCLGKAVTIDGTTTGTVAGTDGDDVIVALAGSSITGLAGNDTICVLPGTATTATVIDAGPGDDAVDTTPLAAGTAVTATLGPGDDSYAGGAAADVVTAGPGVDTVSTGAGNDSVSSGVAGEANADKIDLGSGDDVLDWHGNQTGNGSVEVGDGVNTLNDGDGGTVAIDANGRRVNRNGNNVLAWNGAFTHYVVESSASVIAFAGTAAAETFEVTDPATGAQPTKVKVDMGAGDDTMTVRANVVDLSTWNGGDGVDTFEVAYNYGQVLLDLRSTQFETGAPDVTVDQRVSNVENVDAVATTVTLKGGDGPNVLNMQGCTMTAAGRAGADTISYGVDLDNAPAITCSDTKLVARGGKDTDTITGTNGDDRLFGNKGEDVINALAGDDVIFGGDDTDRIQGGSGNDKVRGGKGDDMLGGNEGNDRVQGDQGNDRLLGHSGNDTLVGGLGFDRGDGGPGFDRSFKVENRRNIERAR